MPCNGIDQRVHIGSFDFWICDVAIESHFGETKIVNKNEENVWLWRHFISTYDQRACSQEDRLESECRHYEEVIRSSQPREMPGCSISPAGMATPGARWGNPVIQ